MVDRAQLDSEEAHRQEDSPVHGVQLVVEGALRYALQLESLENRKQGIRLLQVQLQDGVQRAVIYVPREKYGWFTTILDNYEHERKDKLGRRQHERLVASIEAIRLAIAKDLWSDAAPFPAGNPSRWWEVWLSLDNAEPEDLFKSFTDACQAAGLATGPQWLQIGERLILLVKARPSDWTRSRRVLDMVAELREPVEPAAPYLDLTPHEQAEHVDDLLRRLTPAHPNAPAVCLLDTGVHRGHPLLEDSLLESDWQTVDPAWGESDDAGGDQHGTLMAGTALFADLADWLKTSSFGVLTHRLESVRVLPRNRRHRVEPEDAPALYGKLIEQAVSLAEIRAPYRKRVICLAVTCEDHSGEGLPSSQSAAVDKIAFADGEGTRLLVVSAGNIQVFDGEPYPEHNLGLQGTLEDPAQAYNALSVGACTSRVHLPQSWPDHEPVAQRDTLSPWSRTSAAWEKSGDRSRWPLKPDVVFEGGNWAIDGSGVQCSCYHTELLTTAMYPTGASLDTNAATSAATAQAARLAAMVHARYPDLRAETVRGLIVHSAQWRRAMEKQVPARTKSEHRRRVRVFGYGVPDIERALSSASNAVVLVHEGRIQPYTKRQSAGRNYQMMLHGLPWPKVQLQDLGTLRVRMRVTLSYFIEPNPGRRGTIPKSAYASHALRFDVRRHDEELEAFMQRINADESVRGSDYEKPEDKAFDRPWVLGSKNRAAGSIHCDWWEGTAEELADCDAVAVYPTSGWWKDRPHRGKTESVAPYSLVVSIETEDTSVDLYNMIATQTEVPVEIASMT